MHLIWGKKNLILNEFWISPEILYQELRTSYCCYKSGYNKYQYNMMCYSKDILILEHIDELMMQERRNPSV